MRKSLYVFFFSALLVASASSVNADNCTDSSELELVSNDNCFSQSMLSLMTYDPTYEEGYEDGEVEGRALASRRDVQTYRAFLTSYRTYASRYPHLVAYHDYFQGKYLGLIDGWQNYNSSGTGLGPTPEYECEWDANGIYKCKEKE